MSHPAGSLRCGDGNSAIAAKVTKPSSASSSGQVEVGGVKIGYVQAGEYDGLAIAGLERRSGVSVGEMGHHIEVRADPIELDDIFPRMEIGDLVGLNTFRRRENEGVTPFSAGQDVIARAAGELIIAVAAIQLIVSSVAEQVIIAANSADADVIAVNNVVTSATVKFVAPDAAGYLIVAVVAEHPIIAVGCAGVIREDNVITATTVNVVIAGAAKDCVIPVFAIDHVVAVRGNYGVVPISSEQHIVAVRARDDIGRRFRGEINRVGFSY
jgi:hypothetical protein